jgi:uncharacterized membrane protein YraQ (UPF0718 family)
LAETLALRQTDLPLLIVGVFIAGMVRSIVPEDWIERWRAKIPFGQMRWVCCSAYSCTSPTLVEVPIARYVSRSGDAQGAAAGYLLADPELSLQSILVTSKIMGRKNATYVGGAVFSTLAGYLFGMFLAAV